MHHVARAARITTRMVQPSNEVVLLTITLSCLSVWRMIVRAYSTAIQDVSNTSSLVIRTQLKSELITESNSTPDSEIPGRTNSHHCKRSCRCTQVWGRGHNECPVSLDPGLFSVSGPCGQLCPSYSCVADNKKSKEVRVHLPLVLLSHSMISLCQSLPSWRCV